jgi:hypothetical protein
MLMPRNIPRLDGRDKRYAVRRRRVRLPWFIAACIVTVAGFMWASKRAAPSSYVPMHIHSADGAAMPAGNDW